MHIDSAGTEINSSEFYTSYNEKDVMEKLGALKVSVDPITGEAKHLKELNSMGKRRPKKVDPCLKDKNTTKSTKKYIYLYFCN